MKNIWSVICEKSVIDKDTNSISLFNSLEELSINYSGEKKLKKTDVKNIPILFEIVSLWFDESIKDDRKFEIVLEVLDPNNKITNKSVQECVMEKGKKRLRTIAKLNGLGITSNGLYKIIIKYKYGKVIKIASEIPIDIEIN